jgi:hypothetical protein
MTRTALWSLLALLAIAVSGYAITVTSMPAACPPIVRELLAAWPVAAPVHFIGGAIALFVGIFQVNPRLRARYLALHRWTGRVYLLAVAAAGTAGLAMAFASSAGRTARVGFALLAVFWLGASLVAYLRIRERKVRAHQEWMIRSYALTLAAVTLRIYLPLSLAAGVHFTVAYPAIAWLCWVPNLLVGGMARPHGPGEARKLRPHATSRSRAGPTFPRRCLRGGARRSARRRRPASPRDRESTRRSLKRAGP